MHSTPPARRGWRKRWSLLVFLSLLLALPIGLVAQTPALASVTVNAFAGTGTAGFSGDGSAATAATLNQPTGVATDGVGDVYIFDNLNKRVRQVDSGGTIHTVAGNGNACSSSGFTDAFEPDNPGVCSSSGYAITDPGFTASPSGYLFFNNGGWLDMTPAGAPYGYHFSGKTSGSYSPGDGGVYSVSVAPYSMADYSNVLPENSGSGLTGGLFFAEPSTSGYPGNSIKLDSGGVTTIAGMSGTQTCNYHPSDGQAAMGACIHPQDLAVWSHYLYFFDSSPGYQGPEIFRIDLSATPGSRTLQKIAGSGSWSNYGSDGSAAVNDGIAYVGPIAIDGSGNVFFGSTGGGSVREVDTSGKLWHPTDVGAAQGGMAFDSAGNLYDSLPSSNKVVKVTGLGSVTHKGNLVALGDSVAAGEGINYGFEWNGTGWIQASSSNPSWTDTTTALGDNFQQCHQSNYAYSRYFYTEYTVYNMACTGASVSPEAALGGASTPGGILTAQTGSGFPPAPQLGGSCTGCDPTNTHFTDHQPNVVLLTVGADDIDFKDWIQRCYTKAIGCGSSGDSATLNGQINTYSVALNAALAQLNDWAGNNLPSPQLLTVVVTDYYNPYGSTYNLNCADEGNSSDLLAGIDSPKQSWIVNGLGELDESIYDEVGYAQSNFLKLNMKFVDLSGITQYVDSSGNTENTTFPVKDDIMSGHKFCSSGPWVYGPSIDYPVWTGGNGAGSPAPMHPTPEGQFAIYNAIVQQAGL